MRIDWGNLGNRLIRTPRIAGVVTVLLLVLIGLLDSTTGPGPSMVLLYLIPVLVAALGVGDWFAAIVCVVITIIASIVRMDGGPLTPAECWNATSRLAILLSWALLVGRIRTHPAGAHVAR